MSEKPHHKTTARPVQVAVCGVLILSGIVIGATAAWTNRESPAANSGSAVLERDTEQMPLQHRVRQLESTVEETLKIQGQLLELVNELNSKLDPASDAGETRHAAIEPPAAIEEHLPQRDENRYSTRFQRQREHQIRSLVNAGFSEARAANIIDRQERIYFEQMQLSYEYRYLENKTSEEAHALQEKIQTYSNPRRVMEQELNEQEFERYMDAFGGRSEFHIGDLLEDAPAYQAGLRPGDKIIRYNNQRVFHMGDLRSQVYQVAPGGNVAVEIQRNGSSSTETIYIPSGPLGIRG